MSEHVNAGQSWTLPEKHSTVEVCFWQIKEGGVHPYSFILKPTLVRHRLAGWTSCEWANKWFSFSFFSWWEDKPCTKWDDFGFQEFYRNHCSMAPCIIILQHGVILSGWWMAWQSASGSWSIPWRDHELVNRDQIPSCLSGRAHTAQDLKSYCFFCFVLF